MNRDNHARRLQQQLPFSVVTNPVFTSLHGRGSIVGSNAYINPGQVREALVDSSDDLANAPASAYNYSWQYTLPANAELESALVAIHSRMAPRVENASMSRIRIFYLERVRLVRSGENRTARFETWAEFMAYGIDAMRETLGFMFTSNEITDLSMLTFVLDTHYEDATLVAGGVKRKYSEWNPEESRPANYLDMKGVVIVPVSSAQLCGWIVLALHLVLHFAASPLDRNGNYLMHQIWPDLPASEIVEICRAKSAAETTRIHSSVSLFTRLHKSPAKMMAIARLLAIYCGAQQPIFTVHESVPLILAKFPQLKIVVTTGCGNIDHQSTGTQWKRQMAGAVDLESQRKWNLYYSFDSQKSHMHYVENIRLLAGQNIRALIRDREWCHRCLKLYCATPQTTHQCAQTVCDKCSTFFETRRQLNDHQAPMSADIEPQEHYDRLPDVWKKHIDPLTTDFQQTKCDTCLVECYNLECLIRHKTRNKSQCNNRQNKREQCPQCLKITLVRSRHNCAPDRLVKCPNCNEEMKASDLSNSHRCYIQPNDIPHNFAEMANDEINKIITEEGLKFFAFDFESLFVPMTPKLVLNPEGGTEEVERVKHEVNFVCVQQCFHPQKRHWTFNTIKDFVEWLSKLDELVQAKGKKERVTLVAHNLKGYDGRLLFDYYIKQLKITPSNMMWNGTKIMAMSVGALNFRDSLLHFATALSNLPKIFGLNEHEFVKGFFPYKFNVPQNQNYVGPIPGVQYFEPDMMSSESRVKFLQWHRQQRELGIVYNFGEELRKYCISDVNILAQSLQVYIAEGMAMNSGMNPMDSMTIASYAFKVYRSIHMPVNRIAALNYAETIFAKKAMHGGRTDVRQMVKFYSRDSAVDEKVYAKYQDVQSLYPYVQFEKELPCGIPKIFTFAQDNQPLIGDVENWFGIVKCDLLVTKYMHHPTLVFKENDKLMATLNDKKAVVTTTPELHAALKTGGYSLGRVYEYHAYEKSTDLFKSYLRQYLTIKIQCSGMPQHIKTDEDWQEFEQYHKDKLGIQLDKSKMIKNAGKKQIAKLMLNSLWGKFAEGKNYCQHQIVKNPYEYQQLEAIIDTCNLDVVLQMHVGSGEYMFIYKKTTIDEFDDIDYDKKRALRCNIALASFVTAHGAIVLWEEMQKLDTRVLYHDTDSIIYEHRPGEYNIPEGRYLGEWEDETPGCPVVRFVSTGPKTYAYGTLQKPETVSDHDLKQLNETGADYVIEPGSELENEVTIRQIKYQCKCKGFSLNAYNSSRVNFKTLHQLVIGQVPFLTTKKLQFHWDRIKSIMSSSYETKLLRFKYDKGIVDQSTYMVYPFGKQRFDMDESL